MPNKITDWVLELGFDSSKVEKGLKKVEKLMMKTSKVELKQLKMQEAKVRGINKEISLIRSRNSIVSKVQRQPKNTGSRQLAVQKAKNIEVAKETALIRARTALKNRIQKAQSMELKTIKASNILSSSNVANIRKQSALIDERIRKRQMELNIQKQQTMESAKVKVQPVQRPVSQERREAFGGRVRRAGVGIGDLIQLAPLSDAAKRLGIIKDRLGAIEKEVVTSKTPREIHKLNEEFKELNASSRRLGKTQRATAKSFKTTKFAANGLRDSLRNLTRSYISIFAILATGTAALRVAKDFERIRAIMLLSSEGAEDAAKNFEFVQATAERLGADISATADAFAGFNVSAVSAGVGAEESKLIFNQLALSIQATGLNAQRSGLAFLAFKQMLAGPVIQAQEMNQVVEQMPQFTGVARQALKEMGIEGENFREIIATGTVASEQFVRIVARLMSEQAKATGAAEKSQNNLIAAQNRMNNSLKNLADLVARSGLNKALQDIFTNVNIILKVATPAMQAFSAVFGGLVTVITAPLQLLAGFTDILGITSKLLFAVAIQAAFAGRSFIAAKLGAMGLGASIFTAAGAATVLKLALRGIGLVLKTLGIGLILELAAFILDVVRGTDAWKKSVEAVSSAIRGSINWVSKLILKFEILMEKFRLWRKAATDSDFSFEQANRVIEIATNKGRNAGVRELNRRRSEQITNNTSSATNNIEFNIQGNDPKAIADEVNSMMQGIFTGAT